MRAHQSVTTVDRAIGDRTALGRKASQAVRPGAVLAPVWTSAVIRFSLPSTPRAQGQGEAKGKAAERAEGSARARIKSPNPQGTRLWRRVEGEIEGRFDARVLSSRQRGGAAATGHAPNKATGHAQQRTPICRGATWPPAQPPAASPRA
jgi:hypothetical protein